MNKNRWPWAKLRQSIPLINVCWGNFSVFNNKRTVNVHLLNSGWQCWCNDMLHHYGRKFTSDTQQKHLGSFLLFLSYWWYCGTLILLHYFFKKYDTFQSLFQNSALRICFDFLWRIIPKIINIVYCVSVSKQLHIHHYPHSHSYKYSNWYNDSGIRHRQKERKFIFQYVYTHTYIFFLFTIISDKSGQFKHCQNTKNDTLLGKKNLRHL